MTALLSVLLVVCFLLAPAGWGLAPASPAGPELFTHLLVHRDWSHLGGNLVTLLAFGWWFERRRGPLELLLLVTAAGALSGYVEALADPTYPGAIVGASGGLAALLGAFGRFERWAFVVVLPVLALFSWEALDPAGTNADWAHLTGFAVGLVWATFARSPVPAALPAALPAVPSGSCAR
jgi:membrane associated rhomboid family serine protease